MNTAHDLLEILPDRPVRWCACVHGPQSALETLKALSDRDHGERFAPYLRTREIICRVDEGRSSAEIVGSKETTAPDTIHKNSKTCEILRDLRGSNGTVGIILS